MRTPRIFENQSLNLSDTIELKASTSHRLASVLRLEKENTLLLFNGDGYEYRSIITNIKRNTITVNILAKEQRNLESPLKTHLGQAISKGEKMDFVVQKATELGVHVISPLFSERSIIQLKEERLEKKQEHWQKIAIHAAEQCGRVQIPLIEKPLALIEWIQTRKEETRLVLDPLATQTLANTKILNSIALLIGPEGGLTEAEIEWATKHQFKTLKFGPRILRTETATLAIITAIQFIAGDLGH